MKLSKSTSAILILGMLTISSCSRKSIKSAINSAKQEQRNSQSSDPQEELSPEEKEARRVKRLAEALANETEQYGEEVNAQQGLIELLIVNCILHPNRSFRGELRSIDLPIKSLENYGFHFDSKLIEKEIIALREHPNVKQAATRANGPQLVLDTKEVQVSLKRLLEVHHTKNVTLETKLEQIKAKKKFQKPVY